MRILDEDADRKLDRVTLFLTLDEARELRDGLEDLLAKPEGQHVHVPSSDFQKEVTVCVYGETLLAGLHERSRRLIEEDR